MSHVPVGLDIEDMTPKQLRKALSYYANMSTPKAKKDKDKGEDEDKEASENDDLVDLHREKTGDSKPPKVKKDDLPAGFEIDDEEEETTSKKGKN